MIPRYQHNDVCCELEEALKREQHAQELLQEQNQRIQELSEQMEHQICSSDDKEQTLADAVKVNRCSMIYWGVSKDYRCK